MKTQSLLFVLAVFAFTLGSSPHASELGQKRLLPSEIATTINQVSMVLNEYYVYPEMAKEMQKLINMQMSAGKYQNSHTQQQLIAKVQSDLRDVSGDGHISLLLAKSSVDRTTQVLPKTKAQQEFYADFVSKDAATQKIGYLSFNKFSGDLPTKNRIIEAMKDLATSDSLIIDLRENIGGDPNLVALLSSYFLEDNTHLWSVFDRNGDQVFEIRSTDNGEKFTGDLCILTSNKTYSAAEAFAYTLKHLGRACIVGEATGGGAHLVEMKRVSDEIDIRIPVWRAYNFVTESNWEGKGVIPTIEVEASKAKSTAIDFLSSAGKN